MGGQSNGPNGPKITVETEIKSLSLEQGMRNYPGTDGKIYNKQNFSSFDEDKSIPDQLRIVGGTVRDGVFSEVVFAPEQRREIVGREAGKEIQKIPKNKWTLEGGKEAIDNTPNVKKGYEAFKERVKEELKKRGEARVPQTKFSQIVIQELNREIQEEHRGLHYLSYKQGKTEKGTAVYVIKYCEKKVVAPDTKIVQEIDKTSREFQKNLKKVLLNSEKSDR